MKYICAKDHGWRALESINSGKYGGKPCNSSYGRCDERLWTRQQQIER